MKLIIDAHTHLKHGDKDRTEVPAERIVRDMHEAGVDYSVVVTICLPSVESHELILRECRKFPDELIPFAHGLPQEGKAGHRELERAIKELGFAGVKVHFGEFRHDKDRPPTFEEISPFFEFLEALAVPVLLDPSGELALGERIARTFTSLKLIITHLGHPRDPVLIDHGISVCRSLENVWLDCSYCFVPEKIPEAIGKCGASKVIFGSDGPSESISLLALIERIRGYGLRPEEEEAILGGNIKSLLEPTWHFS